MKTNGRKEISLFKKISTGARKRHKSFLQEQADQRFEIACDPRGAAFFRNRTWMASGNAPGSCKQIGSTAGLHKNEIHPACSPEDKARLMNAGEGPTAFVGDGVNDTLAISCADIGIAATDASAATIALADVVIAKHVGFCDKTSSFR